MLRLSARLRAGRFAAALLAAMISQGCAPVAAVRIVDSSVPRAHEIAGVAFHPQEDFQCGPAALATVLNSTGIDITPAQLTPQVYLPERAGSLQLELVAAARRYDRVPYPLEPRREAIVREVAAGNPILVLQNLGIGVLPVWHYAVVVGYDLDREIFVLRSGGEARLATGFTTFERTWARAEHWALAVVNPDRVPSTATEHGYLSVVAALERVGRAAAAKIAYQSALARWPASNAARFGLANTLYQLGDAVAAERGYRDLVTRDPADGAAWNNLAQVLLDQGQLEEAAQAAQRAVDLGGVTLDTARQTQAEIAARGAANPPRLP